MATVVNNIDHLAGLITDTQKHAPDTVESKVFQWGNKVDEAAFKAASVAPSPDLEAITSRQEKLKKLKEAEEKAKALGVEPVALQKDIAALEKNITAQVGGHHKDYGTAIEHHQQALKELKEAHAQHEKHLAKAHKTAMEKVSLTGDNAEAGLASLETLNHNHELAKTHLGKELEETTKFHQEEISKLQGAAKTLEEKSGVKAADHMNKNALRGAAGETKFWSLKNKELAFGKGEGFGKGALRVAGGVVGLGAVIVGAKNIGRSLGIVSPKKDEEGKPIDAGVGNLLIGVGELAGGGLLTVASLTRAKGGVGLAK